MSTMQETELSALSILPWATMFLNYSDAVVADIPADDTSLDWRPTDAAGNWYLSIREQAMHIADERHDLLASITGTDAKDKLFMKEYGGTGKPWEFKPATRDEIIASMLAGRAALEDLLSQPQEKLLETTPALEAKYKEVVAKLRAEGKEEEAARREALGPSRLVNNVLFLVAHEQSHRSVLQTMLRQRGHKVTRYA
ncbi:MAG: hypothetical protein M3R04_06865 [bacterium]|nr:hypothetical protein [bacterium]